MKRIHTHLSVLRECPECGGPSEHISYSREHRCNCFAGYQITKREASFPCSFRPGSAEKSAVLSARYHYGISFCEGRHKFSVFHPGDTQLEDCAVGAGVVDTFDDDLDYNDFDE